MEQLRFAMSPSCKEHFEFSVELSFLCVLVFSNFPDNCVLFTILRRFDLISIDKPNENFS